jgi:hypothetical protein
MVFCWRAHVRAYFFNLMVGENGFVTAALLGGSLVFPEKNPILAGCLIGLLSFNPQLGFLFPLALIAGPTFDDADQLAFRLGPRPLLFRKTNT